jgi:hypothetical protein
MSCKLLNYGNLDYFINSNSYFSMKKKIAPRPHEPPAESGRFLPDNQGFAFWTSP